MAIKGYPIKAEAYTVFLRYDTDLLAYSTRDLLIGVKFLWGLSNKDLRDILHLSAQRLKGFLEGREDMPYTYHMLFRVWLRSHRIITELLPEHKDQRELVRVWCERFKVTKRDMAKWMGMSEVYIWKIGSPDGDFRRLAYHTKLLLSSMLQLNYWVA